MVLCSKKYAVFDGQSHPNSIEKKINVKKEKKMTIGKKTKN